MICCVEQVWSIVESSGVSLPISVEVAKTPSEAQAMCGMTVGQRKVPLQVARPLIGLGLGTGYFCGWTGCRSVGGTAGISHQLAGISVQLGYNLVRLLMCHSGSKYVAMILQANVIRLAHEVSAIFPIIRAQYRVSQTHQSHQYGHAGCIGLQMTAKSLLCSH